MDVRRSVREPDFDASVNIVGTLRLLQTRVKYGVGWEIVASTGGAVDGEQNEFPAPEGHPQYPISPYGVSKLAGERYLHNYHVQYGISYAALRYANVYGPRQDPHGEAGVVAIFCRNLSEGRASTINGGGARRETTFTSGMSRANVLALEGDLPSGAYNIGTGIETNVNQLYELLRSKSGRSLPANHGPTKPGEQLRSSIDPTLAGGVLGWHPKVTLATGLEEALRFFGAI